MLERYLAAGAMVVFLIAIVIWSIDVLERLKTVTVDTTNINGSSIRGSFEYASLAIEAQGHVFVDSLIHRNRWVNIGILAVGTLSTLSVLTGPFISCP